MSYLPENYPASLETVTFQEALQPEVETMWDARNSLLRQLDPRKATWALDLYEEALAIRGASGLDLETRRRQVIAKLQGMGPTTVEVVRELCETLTGVPCEVVEVYDEYRFEVRPGPVAENAPRDRKRLGAGPGAAQDHGPDAAPARPAAGPDCALCRLAGRAGEQDRAAV